MLMLALTLMFAAPQAAPQAAAPTTAEQTARDARAAADAADREAQAMVCREAREAKRRIVAAAARLGEGDPDLVLAWAAADRIERMACRAA